MALSRDELAKTLKPLVISWIQAGGTIGPYAPANAHFVTTQLETSLTAESVLTAGTLISVSTATVSLASGTVQYQYPVTGAGPSFTPAWSDGYLNITAAKTLTVSDSTTLANASITLANTGSLTLPAAATTITGGGTLALATFTLTVPATGQTLVAAVAATVVGYIPFYSTTTGVVTSDSALFWDNVNKRLGIGTTGPGVRLHVYGESRSKFDYHSTSDTNITRTAVNCIHSTTQDMVDGFGVNMIFSIEDSAGTLNDIGYIQAVRDGADNSGAIELVPKNAGSYVTGALWIDSTGNVGSGTTTPDRKSHTEVSDAITAAITYATRTSHTTSGTAAALFGVGHEDELEDAAWNMQVASEQVTLWATATSGQESPLYRVTTYPAGSIGPGYGTPCWTWNSLDNTSRTVIPDGNGDVRYGIRVMWAIYLNLATTFASGCAECANGASIDLYNAAGEQFTLSVAADGSVTVQRAAGTDTAKVVLSAVWI